VDDAPVIRQAFHEVSTKAGMNPEVYEPAVRSKHPGHLFEDKRDVVDVGMEVGAHDRLERRGREGKPGGVAANHRLGAPPGDAELVA
jgi:hypothetical protein